MKKFKKIIKALVVLCIILYLKSFFTVQPPKPKYEEGYLFAPEYAGETKEEPDVSLFITGHRHVRVYDDRGYLLKKSLYKNDEFVYEKTYKYHNNGVIAEEAGKNYREIYDTSGNNIETIYYNEDGSQESRCEKEFTSKGLVRKEILYDQNDNVKFWRKYRYFSGTNVCETRYSPDDTIECWYIHYNTDTWIPKRFVRYDIDGTVTKYVYDN